MFDYHFVAPAHDGWVQVMDPGESMRQGDVVIYGSTPCPELADSYDLASSDAWIWDSLEDTHTLLTIMLSIYHHRHDMMGEYNFGINSDGSDVIVTRWRRKRVYVPSKWAEPLPLP